jgi:hypothetical protein
MQVVASGKSGTGIPEHDVTRHQKGATLPKQK